MYIINSDILKKLYNQKCGRATQMLSEDENDYENGVHVYIFNECKYVPPITIF